VGVGWFFGEGSAGWGWYGELIREGLAGVRVCPCTFPLFVCMYAGVHVYVCVCWHVCMCVCSYGHLRGHYLFGPGVIVFIFLFNVPRKDIARVEKRA
jgi:hypothetical protein